jgi:nicotinamidase/pyrazinamidase
MAAGPASYDRATALVVLDVQNDFAHPDGNLYVSGGEQIIPAINDQVAAARGGGAFVVYTQDWHPESTPHFEKDGGIWPTHCVQGTWGAAFHADLDVDGPVVQKGTGGEDGYSGFTVEHPATGERRPTDLDTLLRERDVRTLVVVGLCQDVCVKDTVLDAARLGYRVSVLTAATRPVNLHPGDGEAALRTMADVGAQIVDA